MNEQAEPSRVELEAQVAELRHLIDLQANRLAEQERETAAQRQQLADLQRFVPSANDSVDEVAVQADALPEDRGDDSVSRRGLLLKGAGAAALGATVLLANTSPVAAAPNYLTLGTGNSESDATTLTYTSSTSKADVVLSLLNGNLPGAGLAVNNKGLFAQVVNKGYAVHGRSGATDLRVARGINATAGLLGEGTGTTNAGVIGLGDNGAGVVGNCWAGDGVVGQTEQGAGVHGTAAGPGSAGVFEASGGGGYGVIGRTSGTNAAGLFEQTNQTTPGLVEPAIVAHSYQTGGIFAESKGTSDTVGGDAVWGKSNSAFAGMKGENTGTGPGGWFISDGSVLRLSPATANRPAPAGDAYHHDSGDIAMDKDYNLWVCVAGGNPATWRKVTGPATAGAFHLLPAPVRVYDSRPFTNPGTGPKTPLVPSVARVLDVSGNSSGVPSGATGVMCNLLVLNAVAGNGNLTIWSNSAGQPAANTMVWGGTAGRCSSLAVTALDPSAKCQVMASIKVDLALDVVGYYQ